MRWGANVLDVIKVASLEAIATGRGFAALLDSSNLTSRHDAVLNSTGTDHGGGVPYQVQYSLNASGNGTEKIGERDSCDEPGDGIDCVMVAAIDRCE